MMSRGANRHSAIVIEKELLDYSESAHNASTTASVRQGDVTKIPVGSPEWFEWLQNAKRFAYILSVQDVWPVSKTLTIRKETKQRGGQYWVAYSKDKLGKLQKAYAGKTEEMTIERLQQVSNTMMARLGLSYPTAQQSNDVIGNKLKVKPGKAKLPNKAQLPPLGRKDLPTYGRPLTEKARNELFTWCEAEYKRRHGRDWRFKGGKITRTPDGKFRLHYKPSFSLAIGAWTQSPSRYWLEIELLGILNDALDQRMTLK